MINGVMQQPLTPATTVEVMDTLPGVAVADHDASLSLGFEQSSPSSKKPSTPRKHRCWQFHVAGIGEGGAKECLADALPAFRARYTSVTRMVLRGTDAGEASGAPKGLCVEVQFTGPQPGLGPGSLLCALLSGTSVEARPVQLVRGRKKKARVGPWHRKTGDADQNMRQNKRRHLAVREGGKVQATSERATQGHKADSGDVPPSGGDGKHSASNSGWLSRESLGREGESGAPSPNVISPSLMGLSRSMATPESPSSDAKNEAAASSRSEYSLPSPREDALESTDTSSVGKSDSPSSDDTDHDFESAMLDNSRPRDGCSLSLFPDQFGRNWSLDQEHVEVDAFCGRGSMKNDSDWDGLLISPQGGVRVGSELGRNGEPTTIRLPPQQGTASDGVAETAPSTGGISFDLLQKECNFDGRSQIASPRSPGGVISSDLFKIAFTGLESTGDDPRMLTATAHFWVDPTQTVRTIAGPIQMDADGRMCAVMCYPSMKELWPEVHKITNIRMVMVDVLVDVRSRNGEFQYSKQLQVTYRRTPVAADHHETRERGSCRRICAPSRILSTPQWIGEGMAV